MSEFDSIQSALVDIAEGKMVIVCDDEDRENEGDLIMAAEKVTSSSINFMVTFGRGIVCAPITSDRAKELELSLMVKNSIRDTAFTVSVDCIHTGSGISTYDRARTIKSLVNNKTKICELVRPGHIFPLIAKSGGVIERPGHTEAAVDLARLAGLKPAGVLCEVLKDDGNAATAEELQILAKKFDLKIITVKDLIKYRKQKMI